MLLVLPPPPEQEGFSVGWKRARRISDDVGWHARNRPRVKVLVTIKGLVVGYGGGGRLDAYTSYIFLVWILGLMETKLKPAMTHAEAVEKGWRLAELCFVHRCRVHPPQVAH